MQLAYRMRSLSSLRTNQFLVVLRTARAYSSPRGQACALLIFAMMIASQPGLMAQLTLGTINGTVIDPGGAVVVNAEVTAKNDSTGITRNAQVNAEGRYTIPLLPAGDYTVTVASSGFQRTSAKVGVGVNQSVSCDLRLSPGQVSQEIQVTAISSELSLERDSHEISSLVTTEDLQNLPTPNRSFMDIATIGPGAQPATDGAGGGSVGFFGAAGRDLILSGQSTGRTQYLQDGVTNINLFTQSANIISSIDSIKEANIETSGSSARFADPGVVNVLTKGGGNSFHGTTYDYLQNDALDAKNYFASTKGAVRYNQFGGNLGGPILKNKLFAFFDYAGQRAASSNLALQRVPTDEERQGLFGSDGVTIYDPSTFNAATGAISPFPGNTIPADRISAFGSKFLSYLPHANTPLVNGINYVANLPLTNNYDQYLGRVDYSLSSRDTLFGAIQTSVTPTLNPTIVPGLFGILFDVSGWNAYIQDVHVFSPSLVNSAKVAYNRSILIRGQQGGGKQNYTQELGLTNLNPTPSQDVPPLVSITSCCRFGDAYTPQGSTQNLFEYSDEINWSRGKHNLYFGGIVDRVQFDGEWGISANGQVFFNGQYTSNHKTGAQRSGGYGFADFLLGYAYQAIGSTTGIATGAFRETDVAAYLQDDWKIMPKLTINAGLRYEFHQPPTENHHVASIYDVPTNTLRPGAWNSNYLNFAPRVGLAYALDGRTSLRSGFGIYFNSVPYNFLQLLLAHPPNYLQESVTVGLNTPAPVGNLFSAHPPANGFVPFTMSPSMPTPYVEQWNLSLERSFTPTMLFTLAYVGNSAHHQPQRVNPNQGYQHSDPSKPPVRPYPYTGDVFAQYNIQDMNYHGLQTSLKYRSSHDLSFLFSYTWSKAMDEIDNDDGFPGNGLDPHSTDYGPSSFNRKNLFVGSFTYGLPVGEGHRVGSDLGWASRQVLGGWQVSGVTSFEDGLPFSVLATDLSNTGGYHTSYADRVCNGNLPSGARSRLHWFQTSCFTQPAPGFLGNARRSAIVGPGAATINLSAFKRFSISEKSFLEFRTDFFGAFNHPLFLNNGQSQSITGSTYGALTVAAGERVIQPSLKVVF